MARRDLWDRALVLLGFGGAFPRSELVALDVALTVDPVRGVLVRVQHFKTDQLGAGADVVISFGSRAEVCPIRARGVARDCGGAKEALIRNVDRHGRVGDRLDGRDVTRTLKALAAVRDRLGAGVGALAAHGARDHRRSGRTEQPRDRASGTMDVAHDGRPLHPHRRRPREVLGRTAGMTRRTVRNSLHVAAALVLQL